MTKPAGVVGYYTSRVSLLRLFFEVLDDRGCRVEDHLIDVIVHSLVGLVLARLDGPDVMLNLVRGLETFPSLIQ